LTARSRQGSVGVEIVSSIVSNELKWLFRKVHLEEDFGIDGYIDVVLDDGSVTGLSLAAQIKCGMSFLKTKTNSGFVFYGEGKHLNYYLNSQLPILIILCDPETRRCYWELFEAQRTEKTASGWKTVIPFTQTLDAKSKEGLLRIVGPAVDHTRELEKHWAFNELLVSMGRILFAIDRRDIETGNIEPISSFFERLTKNYSVCEKLQSKVDISVSGYETDNRELWQVPEVRSWFSLAEPNVKYWFYFLTAEPPAIGLRLLFACLCEVETSSALDAQRKRRVEMDTGMIAALMDRNFTFLNELTDRAGMTMEQNQKISLDVIRLFFPEFVEEEEPSTGQESA
jgi:hypothetical protein